MKYAVVFFFILLSFSCKAIDRYWDDGGDGISWNDPANWDAGGLPTINDNCIIDDDSVAISTEVSVGGVTLYADLTITAAGQLLINNGSFTLVPGKDNTINNYGNLFIINGQLSIPEDGRFQNRLNSNFNVSGDVIGISNSGRIINRLNAEMYISHTTTSGLINQGFFENRGFVQIFECETGIANESLIGSSEKTEILNKGTLEIIGTDEKGIENKGGIIDNEGDLLIYNNGDYSIVSVFANSFKSEMYNRAGASLIVRDGLVAGNQFQNDGLLKVENAGFVAFGSGDYFVNNDTLYVSALEYTGMITGDTLINSATGVILVDSLKKHASYDSHLISNSGYFQNLGKIDLNLDEEMKGIHQKGYLKNEGEIIIFKADEEGIKSEGTIVNTVNAEIVIDSILSGIAFQNFDTLENYGLIQIKNAQNATGYFQKFSYSLAENAGTFQVLDSHDGLNAFYLTDGTFLNFASGFLEFKGNELFSYTIRNKKTLTNSGTLVLDCPMGNLGLINEFNVLYAELPFVLNILDFTILNPDTSQVGLENQGRIINDECAVFRNQSVILNNAGATIHNYGIFKQEGIGKIENNGLFYNDAVITSKDRFFEDVIDEQFGLFANAFYHPVLTDFTYPVFFDNQFASSSIPVTWYNEETLSTAVGTYDSTASLFTTNASPSNDGLFFEILRPDDDCDLLAEIPINNTTAYCEQYNQKNFTGATNNWFTSTNWEDGKMPNVCSDVTIDVGENVILPANYYGIIHKLDVATGAVFETFSGAVLDVRNGL